MLIIAGIWAIRRQKTVRLEGDMVRRISKVATLLGGLGVTLGLAILAFGMFARQPGVFSSNVSGVLPLAPANDTKPLPWRLRIPAIALDAAIQEVGLTRDGKMGIPSSYSEVGWVKTSAQPGQPGNAVITGHVNLNPHQPGIFQNLHRVQVGDFIFIDKDANGQRFKVTNIQTYETAKAPLQTIIGSTDKAHLNLITCAGTWDKAKQEFDQRLVVFTEVEPR